VLSIVRRQIADEDRSILRKDILHAPAWIADVLRPMTGPESVS
jgi:hypothetical protein